MQNATATCPISVRFLLYTWSKSAPRAAKEEALVLRESSGATGGAVPTAGTPLSVEQVLWL
jgi:hypothetical protein